MPGNGTQYRSPMILQLFKNREVQLAAEAQDNPEGGDHRLEFFTRQPTEGDFESVMGWGVLSGFLACSVFRQFFIDIDIGLEVCRLLSGRLKRSRHPRASGGPGR